MIVLHLLKTNKNVYYNCDWQ